VGSGRLVQREERERGHHHVVPPSGGDQLDRGQDLRTMISALTERLRATQNGDGGWGAVQGRQSNTEATALAALALSHVGAAERAVAERGIAWLEQRQLPDGSWPLTATVTTSSWATSLAVICLAGRDGDGARRGGDWLLGHRGQRLGLFGTLLYRLVPGRMPIRLDPELKGWSWTVNEFSWVEPTAYALIALKKLRPAQGDARSDGSIAEAERMLYDRACAEGGWNYGNSAAYGVELPPYLETTAVALLALQDRRDDERTRRALGALTRMLPEATSGLGLSWSILCLRAYGRDVSQWLRHLMAAHAKTGFLGETKPVALALIAAHGSGVFQLR